MAVVPVEPKVFDFLTYVIQNRERVVSKDELIDTIWHGRVISDFSIGHLHQCGPVRDRG